MGLDPETVARFLAAICKQAIRDYRDGWHEPGSPDATAFLQEAGLLRPDGTVGRPERDEGPVDDRVRPAA